MKRIYYHYKTWEDWQHGMYKMHKPKENKIINSASLLKNPMQLYKAMKHVSIGWKFSSKQNLTNRNRNRQAWLGQASCALIHNSSETETKYAWYTLSENEQFRANAIADIIIDEWEKYYAQKKTWN